MKTIFFLQYTLNLNILLIFIKRHYIMLVLFSSLELAYFAIRYSIIFMSSSRVYNLFLLPHVIKWQKVKCCLLYFVYNTFNMVLLCLHYIKLDTAFKHLSHQIKHQVILKRSHCVLQLLFERVPLHVRDIKNRLYAQQKKYVG